jgi:uncharacterized protein YfaP (DUF2135 family)
MYDPSEEVYQGLIANTDIAEKVGNRIFASGIPDGGIYPSVYYGEISNVPALSSDNAEDYAKSTMQVSILSDTGSVKELARAVETVMLTLNWTRLSYTNMTAEDGGKLVYYKLMRFIKTGGMNNV